MNLYYYIGWEGIAALVLPAVSLLLLGMFARSRKRSLFYFRSLLLACVALWLSGRVWDDVSMIRPDRSEEMELGRERQREERMREVRTASDRAGHVRFAEESPEDDDVRLAGEKSLSQLSVYERAAVESKAEESTDMRSYRQRGVQQRDAEKASSVDAGELFESVGEELAEEELKQLGRTMPESDMYLALRWGRFLLFFAKFAALLSLVLFVIDYLIRFNRTIDYYFPLPLGLLLIDRCLPKKLLGWIGQSNAGRMPGFLSGIIRRGDSFIYFGENADIASFADCQDSAQDGHKYLYRLVAGPLRLFPHSVAVVSDKHPFNDPEYIFESAWFSRQSFIAGSEQTAFVLINEMLPLISLRHHTNAHTAHTVHVIWDFAEMPDRKLVDEWVRIAPQINIKMIFICPGQAIQPWFEQMDETFTQWAERSPSPWLLRKLEEGKGGAALYAGLRRSTYVLLYVFRNLGPLTSNISGRYKAWRIARRAKLSQKRTKSSAQSHNKLLSVDKQSPSKDEKERKTQKGYSGTVDKSAEAPGDHKQTAPATAGKTASLGSSEDKSSADEKEKQVSASPAQIRSKEDLAARIRARREAQEKRRQEKEAKKAEIRAKLGLQKNVPGDRKSSAEIPPKGESAVDPRLVKDTKPEELKDDKEKPTSLVDYKKEISIPEKQATVKSEPDIRSMVKPPESAVPQIRSKEDLAARIKAKREEQARLKREKEEQKAELRRKLFSKDKIAANQKKVADSDARSATTAQSETESIKEQDTVVPKIKKSTEPERQPAPRKKIIRTIKQRHGIARKPPRKVSEKDSAKTEPSPAPSPVKEAPPDLQPAPESSSESSPVFSDEAAAEVVDTGREAVDKAENMADEETKSPENVRTIEFSCPLCRLRMAISSEYCGQPVECPGCKGVVTVPAESETETPPASFCFKCPHCEQVIEGQREWIGIPVACPACNQALIVPDPDKIAANVFKFFCQHCGQKLSAQKEWIDQKIECPKCSSSLTILPPGQLL